MSHYLEAKRMLKDSYIGLFLRRSLREVFKDGYAFQNPYYSVGSNSIEILINKMNDEKSILFDASMRVMEIKFSYPCGVTRQVDGRFRAEIEELKKILINASGIEPDEDKNPKVNS